MGRKAGRASGPVQRQEEVDKNEASLDESMALRKKQALKMPTVSKASLVLRPEAATALKVAFAPSHPQGLQLVHSYMWPGGNFPAR